MLMSLTVSLAFIILKYFNIPFVGEIGNFVRNIPFQKVLLEGILGFLLFAGALHVNINDLLDNKIEIGIFATFGVLLSTALVGYFIFALSHILGL